MTDQHAGVVRSGAFVRATVVRLSEGNVRVVKKAAIAAMFAVAAGACFADAGKSSSPAHARPARAKWAKEPAQFMGVNVDGSTSNLCAQGQDGSDPPPCLQFGELLNFPPLGFSIEGTGFEFENKVAYLSVTFDHDDAQRMAALLIQRYGQPMQKQTRLLTSVMGVHVSDTQYLWSGSKVEILFKEHDDSLTKGSVRVTCLPVWSAYQADYLKRNGNPADHL